MKWDGELRRVQEKMVEYAFAVKSLFKERIGFINFLTHITKDCDCMSEDGSDIAGDVGLLGSLDPVALDLASAELIIKTEGRDVLREANDVSWKEHLQYAEKIGLGTTDYELITL